MVSCQACCLRPTAADVPPRCARGSKQQKKNETSVTEYAEIPNRGHSLTIDSGWQEVAQTCLDFIARFVK